MHARFGAYPKALTMSTRAFRSQHRTPILPQLKVEEPTTVERLYVGYVLQRGQIVKHNPHPLETEFAYLLEREHQRYSRHEASESATQFLAARGQTMDLLNRSDVNQIKANFFGLEIYQDAMKVALQRYKPEDRVTPADKWNPAALAEDEPPVRHTLHRKLEDYLYLIVRGEKSGRWMVPYTARKEGESLRMTCDRAISVHHGEGIDSYTWSNAPQATIPFTDEQGQAARLFLYVSTYLSGRPNFDTTEPKLKDHAWVSRRELLQYSDQFHSKALLEALRDITADSTFES
ncbi:39S ribosomal protein L46, mitochondrial [Angomonas deanei]|nr:39S ribosomal protein L46, mitochondrial [Angomonas deanei]EPY38607.1 39S ribosomal protein L46, mitochondrial [Angomonas deanei]|eukprot:EPY24523.1 39S ribosomal protein L46, mitochondrial [Angomonas deanei]